jgi:hypothetical protein
MNMESEKIRINYKFRRDIVLAGRASSQILHYTIIGITIHHCEMLNNTITYHDYVAN